jgi:hypothetical protein
MSNTYYLIFPLPHLQKNFRDLDLTNFSNTQNINTVDITITWIPDENIPNFYYTNEKIYSEEIVLLHTKLMLRTSKFKLMRQVEDLIVVPDSFGNLY